MDQGGDTYQEDKSMNKDEGSYRLSHYDNQSCSPRHWAANGD